MSTGAGDDLARATALALAGRMVTEFGMSERLGVVTLGGQAAPGHDGSNSRSYSEHTR
jgi:cell division protease FtsH